MDNITLNNIMSFDDQRGLQISSKGEILEDLETLTKIAYGTDYVIEQGNEWYSFLDLLAGSLAEMCGATQKVYNTLSFTGASGTNLDNVVSFVGITRKAETNSSVLIKAEVTDTTMERPITIFAGSISLEDSNGVIWINSTDLIISRYKNSTGNGPDEENYIGTATFVASDANNDPTNAVLEPYNNGTNEYLDIISADIQGIRFINEVSSELGHPEETDAQLRARYKEELYRKSVGTVDGLIAQIKENTNATYVYIVENNSGTTISDPSDARNGMTRNSIWVITDGNSTWNGIDYSTDPNDIAIAKTILDYKSLGCGTSIPTASQTYDSSTGEGRIKSKISIDSTEYEIEFSRASKVNCFVSMTLDTTLGSTAQRESIEYQIKQNIVNYINNLGIKNDVLYSGLASAVFDVISDNKYKDFIIDIDTLFVGTSASPSSGQRVTIDYGQYPQITEDNIEITWN